VVGKEGRNKEAERQKVRKMQEGQMKTAKELFFNYKAMYLRYVTGSTTEWL
jgi:hypothetical protein